ACPVMPLWLDNSLPDLVTYAQLVLRSALLCGQTLTRALHCSTSVRYFGEQGEAPCKMRRAKFSVARWQSALAYLRSPLAIVRPLSQSSSNIPALIRFKTRSCY